MRTVFLLFLLAAPASASSSPMDVVRAFYDEIIKHHPIGIPTGDAKRALWPLISSRLARRLEALQACEDDYYRRNKKKLETEQLKPSIGWIESGLFSGKNEQALPVEAIITRIEQAGTDRFRAYLQFTYRDTFETYGRPADDSNAFRWMGIVVVVSEGDHYAVDDYVPIDPGSGKPLAALSEDFPECMGNRWVGLKGQGN
jgi:hypothetical protein